MSLSDEDLVERVKAGEAAAFEALVIRYQKALFNLAYRYTGNREDASDLAQEIFIRAYQSMPGFRQEATFRTWLYQIATNLCRDNRRRRSGRPSISLDEVIATEQGEVDRELEDWSQSPEALVESRLDSEAIQKLLNELPREYRLAVILRDIEGFTYDEIASILRCSKGTVRSRLNRGRHLLQEKITANRELFTPFLRLM
ncbi:MAG: sigma-70 family RNA polymerase sigma factor [Clostridia bacterium]|nr:MAG: sigma-70 family RNA polymerase sigma factor [Clostridia bacterium]